MDGQRFDDVTRAFAAGASRRAVLRTALGGIGAGVLALMGSTNAGAASKRQCVEDCKHLSGRARGQCISACAKGTNKVPDPDAGPVPCGEIPGQECSEGFTCVEGFCQLASCPDVACGEGEYCCNPLCNTCVQVGFSCTQGSCEG